MGWERNRKIGMVSLCAYPTQEYQTKAIEKLEQWVRSNRLKWRHGGRDAEVAIE